MSDLRRSHLPSGCRRTMPDAVHGTSARIRSNARPSHQPAGSPASPATTRTIARVRPRRASVVARRARGAPWSLSSAVSSTSAQLEDMRGLAAGRGAGVEHAHAVATSSNGAASCAPASCTANAPSAKPGSARDRQRRSTMMPCAPPPSRSPSRRANRASERTRACPTRAIDAQRQRRALVARGEDLLPVVADDPLDAADPPARIRPARDRARVPPPAR